MSHELIKENEKCKMDIIKKFFINKIDIEHIQSFNNEIKENRTKVWKEWEDEINCIGNLIILESSLNQSIGNRSNKKYENYKESKYNIVKDFLVNPDNKIEINNFDWTKEKSKHRKEKESEKILNYIYMSKIKSTL